jgi:hypothetical protein
VTIAPALVRISATILFVGESGCTTQFGYLRRIICTAKENSDKYRQEKEAIKVDFIRWVLIFKN